MFGNHIICKCILKDVWDLYPIYKMAFYFQGHYMMTISDKKTS